MLRSRKCVIYIYYIYVYYTELSKHARYKVKWDTSNKTRKGCTKLDLEYRDLE